MPEVDRRQEEGASDSGTAAIFHAIASNPLSALNMLFVLGGFFATYYTLTHEVETARSEVVEVKRNAEILATRVSALDVRGSTRYEEIRTALNRHDITLSEIANDVKWIVRRLDGSATSGVNNNSAGPAPSTHTTP